MTATPILEIDGIEKHFGGLAALGGVHATVDSGKLTAVIGPNGAGKTTLFNVVTGILTPSAGSIRFMGKDITDCSVHEISRLGLARTLQIKSVFHGMTVRENLWIAAQSRRGVFRPFTGLKACRAANERADALLEELQLTHLADIVIIEHDIEVVFDISDDIIVMALGTVLARGTPAEISENADVRAAYLGDDDA